MGVRILNTDHHHHGTLFQFSRLGKAYTIRRDSFRNYCKDLLEANARARSSYLAVASLHQAFPQLLDELPMPDYLTHDGSKIHLGPYMWVALKGHYEFCHYDPDDNFLVIVSKDPFIDLFIIFGLSK